MIKLTDDLLTGVEEMDKDHQKLVDLLNTVYELIKDGKKNEAMHTFEIKLLEFLNHHLTREEKFMQVIDYPHLEMHKKAHENFKKVIFDLLPHVEEGDEKSFREALALAWGWLAGHIAKMDKKYSEYAREKGLIA